MKNQHFRIRPRILRLLKAPRRDTLPPTLDDTTETQTLFSFDALPLAFHDTTAIQTLRRDDASAIPPNTEVFAIRFFAGVIGFYLRENRWFSVNRYAHSMS